MDPLISELIRAAVHAVDPVSFIPEWLSLKATVLSVGNVTYDLRNFENLYLISIGKAAPAMAYAAEKVLGAYIRKGFILTKHEAAEYDFDERFTCMLGGHPVSDERSAAAARTILDFLQTTGEKDLILFLISGGGSALLAAPKAGIPLEDWREFSSVMLGSGADIREFNTLRKHLDDAKGGGLVQAAAPSQCVSLILSDVVGNPPDIIASGPTVPDPGTYADALRILEKYDLNSKMPASILKTLDAGRNGMIPETLKPDEPAAAPVTNIIAADNRKAAYAAAEKAAGLGYSAEVLTTALTGEADGVGSMLPAFFSEMPPRSVRIFGGETTVTLRGSGKGGRNQEVALAAVQRMAELPGCTLVTFATDGEDGPTDAAGAIVTCKTLCEGPDAAAFLSDNDAYHYFRKQNALVMTGPTGTNVNDLTFLIKE